VPCLVLRLNVLEISPLAEALEAVCHEDSELFGFNTITDYWLLSPAYLSPLTVDAPQDPIKA